MIGILGGMGTQAGLDFCKTAFQLIGRELKFKKKVYDGEKVKKNRVIVEIKAKIKEIKAKVDLLKAELMLYKEAALLYSFTN